MNVNKLLTARGELYCKSANIFVSVLGTEKNQLFNETRLSVHAKCFNAFWNDDMYIRNSCRFHTKWEDSGSNVTSGFCCPCCVSTLRRDRESEAEHIFNTQSIRIHLLTNNA